MAPPDDQLNSRLAMYNTADDFANNLVSLFVIFTIPCLVLTYSHVLHIVPVLYCTHEQLNPYGKISVHVALSLQGFVGLHFTSEINIVT